MERQPEKRRVQDPQPEVEPAQTPGGPALEMGSILALQRSAGNAAVASRVASGAGDHAARIPPPPADPMQRALARSVQERERRQPSPAMLLRSQLRSSTIGRMILARAVTTSGGEWDTDQYDLLQDKDSSGTVYPAASGVRGLEIKLKFAPNATVDAELIGLSQSVQAVVGGSPNLTPAAATRAIPAADAKPLSTGGPAGETDEGTAIDRAQGYNNPIYGVANATSTTLADTSMTNALNQQGSHYTDATGKVVKKNATLYDGPVRSGAQKDSRHIFETTALATKGAQAGTYYGSVRWGWRTDSSGTFTKLPLEKVSDGVPSATYMKAAGIWNAGKSSTGAANVQLPTVDVQVTTAPMTLMLPIPMMPVTLPTGTRLQVIVPYRIPMMAGTVKVVDGPHTGLQGEIDGADWANIVDERA